MSKQKVTLNSFEMKRELWKGDKGKYKVEVSLSVEGGHILYYQLPKEVGDKIVNLIGAELYQASVEVSNTIVEVFENIIGCKGVTYDQLEVLEEHNKMGAKL